MTKRTTREIDRFDCEGAAGKSYKVIEYQHYNVWEPLSGPRQEVASLKEYRLSNGRHVNRRDDGTFQIVETDEIIRRVD